MYPQQQLIDYQRERYAIELVRALFWSLLSLESIRLKGYNGILFACLRTSSGWRLNSWMCEYFAIIVWIVILFTTKSQSVLFFLLVDGSANRKRLFEHNSQLWLWKVTQAHAMPFVWILFINAQFHSCPTCITHIYTWHTYVIVKTSKRQETERENAQRHFQW